MNPSIRTPYLSEENTLSKDSILYVGAWEIEDPMTSKYHFPKGYMDVREGMVQAYNYFAKDHLGNVRHVAKVPFERDHEIVQVNNYYPFGGLHNDQEDRADIQNRLYNGKEYDRMHGLNLYDYSARQYDPAVGQFTSIDPLCEKYYHISPHAYCAGNPVRYVDPDGRYIRVSGSADFRSWVLNTLQMLTNDRLTLSKNGYISIAKNGKGQANTTQDLSVGTGLLREVIENSHTAFVSRGDNNEKAVLVGEHYDGNMGRNVYTNENDRYNGKGTNIKIAVRPGEVSGMLVSYNEKGRTREESCPEYITVAHEFIHGIHDMKGEKILNESVLYHYMDTEGMPQPAQASSEELQTVGIVGDYRYSENKIRKEHGLRLRRKY